ncbi:MAG TPA: hypothetical protein VGN52_06845 [Burkholderiales bacterium]
MKTSVITPAAPSLRVSHSARRQALRERDSTPVNERGRFDPRKYEVRPKTQRQAAARAHAAGIDPLIAKFKAALAHADPPRAAPTVAAPRITPTINPPPLRPLVLARPQVRAGGEDYRQHPSRHTPQVREAYWAAQDAPPAAKLQAPRPARRRK